MRDAGDPTNLIHCSKGADSEAVDSLFAASYSHLRTLARARLRARRPDTLLNTTSLVHEFYLRFAARSLDIQDREHFMRYASRAMRSVIVDSVRKRQAVRHGGGGEHLLLTTGMVGAAASGEDEILRVHEAIDELARLDARMAQVVEMRYFAGLTDAEIAEILNVTERTIRRDWEKARLLLSRALQ